MDLTKAAKYVEARLRDGSLTHEDIARLTHHFQSGELELGDDGMPGPATLKALRASYPTRCYPLPKLRDGRLPHVTSGFGPRGGKHHDGCDLFYRWEEEDGPVKLGDGGATRNTDGKPKWFIPSGDLAARLLLSEVLDPTTGRRCTPAIAAAAGVVQGGDNAPRMSKTGWRIWVEHDDGKRTGYFHLRASFVKPGQAVTMGQPLGPVGDNPADVDAEHLHFEVSSVNGYWPEDPAAWLLGAGFVRA